MPRSNSVVCSVTIQAESHDQSQRKADSARLRLLMRRQLVRQDRDEHQIVDAENDFQHDQCDKGDPGSGIGKQGDDIHGASLPAVFAACKPACCLYAAESVRNAQNVCHRLINAL